jgi:mannose-6-phosphate isomerase-like protein (cupin superfamily)
MSFPQIENETSRQVIVGQVRDYLLQQGFAIAELDDTRPWGAFFRIANAQADKFIELFYRDVPVPERARGGERSPKILLVAPLQRLSWQYHDRRGELWRVVNGTVGVYASPSDAQPEQRRALHAGETIELTQGTRHRLAGLDGWGAVAEIWIHTDPAWPSDEDDIHRLQDDYQRELP